MGSGVAGLGFALKGDPFILYETREMSMAK
jgi:hypothetical protein